MLWINPMGFWDLIVEGQSWPLNNCRLNQISHPIKKSRPAPKYG